MERSPDPHRSRARGSPEDATLLGRGPLRTLGSVGMLALALDPEGRIVLASEQLLELTGWSREEVLRQDWFVGHEPGAGQRPGGVPERFETEIISRSGARRLVSWTAAVLRDEGGRVEGTILFGQEVSEERQRLGAIDALADELAHDIDRLLRTAGSCGESLSAGLDAADPRREDALAIVRAAERASSLTRQLLDVSRRRAVQPEGLRVLPPLSVPAGPALEEVVAATGAGPERILLAEDDETIRQLVTEVLTRAGYRVHAAASGDEALALLEEHGASIDLLLTDVVMPGMSGPELARAAQLRRPALRVLYTSGYASEPDEAFEDPGVEFIGKPFSPQALVAKVRDVLGVD